MNLFTKIAMTNIKNSGKQKFNQTNDETDILILELGIVKEYIVIRAVIWTVIPKRRHQNNQYK